MKQVQADCPDGLEEKAQAKQRKNRHISLISGQL